MSSRTTPKRHTHSPSDIIGGTIKAEQIPPGLFAARTHYHAPTEISGLGDYIRDEVGDALIAGSGVTLTQDSVTGAITIGAAGGGGGLDVLDEGGTIAGALFDTIDFRGAGVTVTDAGGGVAQVSIPGGGGGSLEVRDEGTTLTSAAGFIDFRGAGVAATTVSGGVQVSVPYRPVRPYITVARLTANVNVTGGWTRIDWPAEEIDELGCHNNSTNSSRLTVPSGYAWARWTFYGDWANTGGSRWVSIQKNAGGTFNAGTNLQNFLWSGPNEVSGALSTRWLPVSAGDYAEVFALGGTLISSGFGGGAYFMLELAHAPT